MLKDWVLQILAISTTGHPSKHCQMERKFPAFSLYFMMMNILLIFNKKFRFSVLLSLTNVTIRTDDTLSSCHLTKDNNLRIINTLVSNKAHGSTVFIFLYIYF